MKNKPLIVGVEQVNSWRDEASLKVVFEKLGQNSGNIMFTESLSRSLRSPHHVGFSIPESAAASSDVIVVAAANWLNEYEDFSWLANHLENLNKPVILVGIGAQPAACTSEYPAIPNGTLRLLQIAASSSSISVRGEYTKRVLEHYGYNHVVVTGCPSLLLAAINSPIRLSEPSAERVVIHSTRHGFQAKIAESQRWLYRQAFSHNTSILLQSEIPDTYCALGAMSFHDPDKQIKEIICEMYGEDDFMMIAMYLRSHGLFATSFEQWISKLANHTFSVGTRIHGTVASLLAGVPSLLIAHDSRTHELAKSLSLPVLPIEQLDLSRGIDFSFLIDYYHSCEPPFHRYADYVDRFCHFFLDNGVYPADHLLSRISLDY